MTDGTEHLRLEVFMDGDCGLCRVSRRWCEVRDHDEKVRFIDFRDADDGDLPVPRSSHEDSMWVRGSDGDLLEGYAAWCRIMAELPGWRWVSRIFSLPPWTMIGPHLYRFVAVHRRRFNGR